MSLTISCKKETFTPVSEPQLLLLADPDSSIEILQQPLKEEMITWKGDATVSLEVEGTLRIEYDDNTYDFLQLTCPSTLPCNGSKAYVPATMVYRFEDLDSPVEKFQMRQADQESATAEEPSTPTPRPFQLIAADSLDDVLALKAWLHDPNQPLPALQSEVQVDRLLEAHLQTLTSDLRERQIAEWYYLAVSFDKALRNEAFVPYLKQYQAFPAIIQVATGKTAADAGIADGQERFLRELSNYSQVQFERMAQNMGHDFPFQAETFAELAKFFNEQLKLPLYRALIFKQILDDVPHEALSATAEKSAAGMAAGAAASLATGSAAPDRLAAKTEPAAGAASAPTTDEAESTATPVLQVLNDLEFGAVVKYRSSAGETEERIFPKIQAVAHRNGLAFELETNEGERLRVQPLKLSSFLAAANRDTLKKFRQLSQDEIMAADSYARRAMLTALKYGVGDYDRDERRFRYTLKLSDPAVYWKVLALFKSAPAIDVFATDVYKGPLNAEVYSMSQLTWYQTYNRDTKDSALKLNGTYSECMRECFTEQIDVSCMDNQSDEQVIVEFAGKSLTAESPQVDITITYFDSSANNYRAIELCGNALGVSYSPHP